MKYFKKVSDYIDLETYKSRLTTILTDYYKDDGWGRPVDMPTVVAEGLKHFDSDEEWQGLGHRIRHAIIAKTLGMDPKAFAHKYQAIWPELPVLKGLKPGAVYAATWGYDQTQVTTATHYGRAFGLDVLVTGGFGRPEVLLKRIGKDGTFDESCMYFRPNRYTDEEIQEINTRATMFGR